MFKFNISYVYALFIWKILNCPGLLCQQCPNSLIGPGRLFRAAKFSKWNGERVHHHGHHSQRKKNLSYCCSSYSLQWMALRAALVIAWGWVPFIGKVGLFMINTHYFHTADLKMYLCSRTMCSGWHGLTLAAMTIWLILPRQTTRWAPFQCKMGT